MESPNIEGDKAPNIYLMSASETSSASNGLHIVKLFSKGAPWKPLKIIGYCQNY